MPVTSASEGADGVPARQPRLSAGVNASGPRTQQPRRQHKRVLGLTASTLSRSRRAPPGTATAPPRCQRRFSGGSLRITPRIAAIARWLARARLSKIRSCSFPRSMAMTTARCAEFTGVITRSGRDAQAERARGHGANAHAAAEAHVPRSTLRLLAPRPARVVGRDQGHRLDGAGLDALPAAGARPSGRPRAGSCVVWTG